MDILLTCIHGTVVYSAIMQAKLDYMNTQSDMLKTQLPVPSQPRDDHVSSKARPPSKVSLYFDTVWFIWIINL